MADSTWPMTLPQNVVSGVTCAPRSNVIVTTNSTGYSKVRPVSTKRYREYSVEMEMTLEQYDIFLNYFHNDLGYGELYFNFPDPLFITDYIEVRMVITEDGDPYEVTPLDTSDDLSISFSLEELDLRQPSGTSTNVWPTQLPPLPLHDGFSQKEQSGVVKDTRESGIIDVRRRFTAVSTLNSVSFVFNKTELIIFEAFFADQGFGTKPFTITAPLYNNETIKVRFDLSGSNPYSIGFDADTLDYFVTFSFIELPGQSKTL